MGALLDFLPPRKVAGIAVKSRTISGNAGLQGGRSPKTR